ncbi:hypothetical protein BKA93DRAFT_415834 [Sparassis latifolia]
MHFPEVSQDTHHLDETRDENITYQLFNPMFPQVRQSAYSSLEGALNPLQRTQARRPIHTQVQVVSADNTGKACVPQAEYASPRYFICQPAVSFSLDNGDCISLETILKNPRREYWNKPAFDLMDRRKISLRILWPGYHPYARQIRVRDESKTNNIIPRWKLASLIAKETEKFIEGATNQAIHDEVWRVGPDHINTSCIFLIGLQHVSEGSWQPIFSVNMPSPTTYW